MTDFEIAKQVCTDKELQAYELTMRGYSERSVALDLKISRSAVRSRLENARRKIHAAQLKALQR